MNFIKDRRKSQKRGRNGTEAEIEKNGGKNVDKV
jgi:hypothetical protein